MNVFTQIVLIIGRLEPSGVVVMLGTGFLINEYGLIATTYHVIGSLPSTFVVLAPHIQDINTYQDLSNHQCQPIRCEVKEVDPFRDIAILKSDITCTGVLPQITSFDSSFVGEDVVIFGFPHCVEGRRALTYQKSEIGAKVIVETDRVKTKQVVINSQARPGQSGSIIVSPIKKEILGVLLGAWVPDNAGLRLGNIDPRELHQTTHCVSAEYILEML